MSELSELDMGLNDIAFSDQVQQQQQAMPNRHGLYVEFFLEPVQDKAASLEAGHPKYFDMPYVMIMVPGDKGSVIRRPIRIGQHPDHDNNRFHNEYVAFMQKEKQPVEGMPLAQWPVVTKSQVLELKHMGILTVETLASVSDGHTQKYMGLATLKDKAKKYLDTATDDAPFQKMYAEIEHRNNEISTLQETMKEMQAELAELKGGKKKGK